MARPKAIPPEAVTLRTYAELAAQADAFFADHYHGLIVIGPSGIGKSEMFRQRVDERPEQRHYIEGHTTPLATYIECYENRHKLLTMDDAESLWLVDSGKQLLRQLTDHRVLKYIQWKSTVRELERIDVPKNFTTTSKCAFLMNRFTGNDVFAAAILDRCQVFYFDPPPLERHRYIATWFCDQEVHDFVGANLPLIGPGLLTARLYNNLRDQKLAGQDWRQYFFDRCCSASLSEVVQHFENDRSFPTTTARIREFVRRGFGCPRTYKNYKAKLVAANGTIPKPAKPIPVQGVPPEQIDRDALLQAREEEALPQPQEEEEGEDTDLHLVG